MTSSAAAPLADARPGRAAPVWHALAVSEVAAGLGSDPTHGLDAAEARARLARDGPNRLDTDGGTSGWRILARQFASVVIWVLVGAAAVAVVLGDVVDGAAILAIVVLNAVVGFLQEYRAERAVAALARLAAPRARVVRDGAAAVVPAAEVVRGDVLLLDAGDLVAADARLVEAAVLRVTEAPLTGESEPVEKGTGTCSRATSLADRRNMVFLGTSVAAGSGRAIVVATGMATEVGHIAALLETASPGATPLQRQLDAVGRRLLVACSGIVVLVFALGLLRGLPVGELFFAAVGLAVAAVPEGLPAVVTVALALGVSRMARRHALVRRLPAVETLGAAQVVCTDKTGTLTLGEMTVRRLVTAEGAYGVSGEGYAVDGAVFSDGREVDVAATPVLRRLLEAAAGCNDASLVAVDGRPGIVGDPTEGALLVAAAKAGITREALEAAMPRVLALPFDAERKRMTVVRRRDGRPWALVKGAPEVVLARTTAVLGPDGPEPFDDAGRARMLEAAALLAADALRVLAFAERPLGRLPPGAPAADEVERDLVLLGLVGLQDPPRPEAREAVRRCRRAGIRTVMITGDHPDTARAIARELELLRHGDTVLVGDELDALDDAALAARVARVVVYARVTAEHKLRIVRAWKARGAVVAMTGDGVNDAPALKEASIGIAMGITGTEVTKEAADMVITDDDFASIVAAVEEGRGIWDNITKTLGYLLAGNAAELAVMLVAVLVGWPLPLLPIHLLWINLVTDGLPALALATDPIDPDVLARPPRPPAAPVMARAFLVRLVLVGCLDAAVTLAAFTLRLEATGDVAEARSAAFAVLVLAELFRSFAARSPTRTIAEVGLLSNARLLLVVAASLALQAAIHQVPALRVVFDTVPIAAGDVLAGVGLGLVPLVVLETAKLVRRRR